MVFNEDTSFSLLGNVPECAIFLVKRKTISIDCNFNDWTDRDRVYLDTDGPDCGNVAGRDIREVYLAQDSSFVYVRYVLNGPLDPTFGYKFGADMHILVRILDGRSDINYFMPGAGNGSFSSSSACTSGNQLEFRVGKSDVRPFWAGRRLAAWSDQGTTTICRDFIDLPVMDLGL
jgi:hypothetical protein